MIFDRVWSDICVLDTKNIDFQPRLNRYLCFGLPKTTIFNRVWSDIGVLDIKNIDFRPRVKRYLFLDRQKLWFSNVSQAIFVFCILKT